MTPVIAMPFHAALESNASGRSAQRQLPELPVLSDLLHGARRLPDAMDWRSGVLTALGLPAAGTCNPVQMAARSIPDLKPATALCMALPVHVVAGMSRMFLGAPDSFALEAAEREALRLAFNVEFGVAGAQLHAAGNGWLLQAPYAAAASDGDPELLMGHALTREPAESAAARSLRRLGAEVEMWLATLPFNAARERRGLPPINCIWCWSGATVTSLPTPPGKAGGLFIDSEADPWITGLGCHCDIAPRLARDWSEARDVPAALVILQSPDAKSKLPEWEERWLAPARQDLATGHLQALRLQIGHRAWQLPARRLGRWLRRARPWWQQVSA